MATSDSTRSSSGRALSRFKPTRLASVLRFASSTASYDEPSDNIASPTPHPPSDEPSLAVFTQSRASPSIAGVVSEGTGETRRDSGEFRALVANEARRILAIETAPGKRRKSLIELEEMMDGLDNATLASRRRSSLGPLQPLATTPFRPAIDDFDFAPTAQCDRTASTSTSLLPNDQPLLASHAYKAFPSSPTMPSISPSTPGCFRFSDEPLSPYLDGPQMPRTPQSPVSSPVSLASATFATASPHRNPHIPLKPRSPRAFRPHDPLFDDECAQKAVIRSPSGIDMRFPLVFPSRSSPSIRMHSTTSIPPGGTDSTYSSTVDSVVEDEDEEPSPTPRSTRPPKPFFASPFPPPCVSLAQGRQALDTQASLSTYRHASSHAQQSSPARRPSVASSSFASSSDDGRRSSLYSSPDTFGLRNSPFPTAVTIVLGNPFSAAFAAGTT